MAAVNINTMFGLLGLSVTRYNIYVNRTEARVYSPFLGNGGPKKELFEPFNMEVLKNIYLLYVTI